MNIFSFFITTVFAAEALISPLTNGLNYPTPAYNIFEPVTTISNIIKQDTIKISRNNIHENSTIANGVAAQNISPTPTIPLAVSPTDSPKHRKNNYTIAVLGDSMVDTLGVDLMDLKNRLLIDHPGVTFSLYNFGVGATNIDNVITRITSSYEYLGQPKPSLISMNPDIVVIESFGYNPFPEGNGAIDRHWLALARTVDTVKQALPEAKIIIAATIAPNSDTFADGAPGLNMSFDEKLIHTNTIKQYLVNAIRFAQSQKLPLADAYTVSLDRTGNGRPEYINADDHIHYSDSGRKLFSGKIADAVSGNRLLE